MTNLSRLQNVQTFKVKSVKLMVLIMLCTFLSVMLASVLHPLFGYLLNWDEAVAGFAKELDFISANGRTNAIIITVLQFFDLWLNIFYYTTVIYMMAIFIHFHQEFKHLYNQLYKLIQSGGIYRADSFSKWRKYFSSISVLIEDLNDNMKLYIFYTILLGCSGVLGVLYNTTVSCDTTLTTMVWGLKYLALLLGVMVPGVAVSSQVI